MAKKRAKASPKVPVTSARRGAEPPRQEPAKPPDTLWQLILHTLWALPIWLRLPVSAILVALVTAFAFWATLPDSSKELVMRPLIQPPPAPAGAGERPQVLVKVSESLTHKGPRGRNWLENGHFDRDLAKWGWPRRFLNAAGAAVWSRVDASDQASSGSAELRVTLGGGNVYQQAQCLNLAPGDYYYGLSYRQASREGSRAVIALINFKDLDCNGDYAPYQPQTLASRQPGVWESHAYRGSLAPQYKSLMVVIGVWARHEGTHSVWFDDVSVRPVALR
jgi:hypothetical protein